jgi:oligosaccharide reducing-end xylanase
MLSHVSLFASAGKGAYFTGDYPNLFVELLGKSQAEVQTKIDAAWNQLFQGNDSTQRVFYPAGPDMGYIEDVLHRDVRSEGQSYGMMIAVQMDKKAEFDRLWKWAKTFMQHQQGQRKGYFAWQVNPNGTVIDPNSASDGEEWFATALFLASARWGDGTGIFDYRAEAQAILDAMLSKTESSDNDTTVTNLFNKTEKQVVFVPVGNADDFTDPSYHLPHFYELWARRADKNNAFWRDAASTSRRFLKKAVNPKTGLAPDYAHFDGTPADFWNGGHGDFRFDAWRVAANVAMDHVWFGRDNWEIEQNNRWLEFFASEGLDAYVNQYKLDGERLSSGRSSGLIAINAAACLASTHPKRKEFVQALWNMPVPDGMFRYYDGMLYMLALLQVSGNFKIYQPNGGPISDRP